MKQNHSSTPAKLPPTKGVRPWLRLGIALMVLGAGGLAYLHFASGKRSQPPDRDRPDLDPTVANITPQQNPSPRPSTRAERAPQGSTGASHARTMDATAGSEPPDQNRVRQWVSSLAMLDTKGGSISAQQAAIWKQNLQQLIGAGTQAVPAIREFLARNQDIDLSSLPGGKQLGYDTTRQALFGALSQIGGPEAQSLLLDTLNTTADPGELALIAKNLETMAPGQYRDQVLSAARETLQMASSGQLTGQRDLGPLFDLFQRLGDGKSAEGLLAAAKNWGYYATQTLARLPDGAGIDDLIKLATDPALGLTRADFAYQALADAAWNQPKAAEALVMQAREGHIPPSAWAAIAEALGGLQTYISDGVVPEGSDGVRKIRWVHLDLGNQNYYAAQSLSMTAEELGMRISILDQLLPLNNDPTVVAQLQGQRKNLQSRFNPTPGRAL